MITKSAVAFLLILASSAFAEIVQWQACPTSPNAPLNCTVHEVRVDPCKEADQGKPCKIKRGIDASISFDFTPNFDATTAESRAYWVSPLMDLPFVGMETDACKATQCPIVKAQKKSYTMHLPIAKSFPIRAYDVKWKLWNDKEQDCCFIFQIKLTK
ncbi:MD-2-related lipid-recognition protein-like [Belonocnema kinseyi]|uniref:MD-2-related lipid-recognition protein-like n=1 Tax=Belonocnema kinseyi TaxID=2817044 RepID=UPI00143D0AC6|nr:MD-2-related lipid-recognition protein-like [Belonocnema kinseyi]